MAAHSVLIDQGNIFLQHLMESPAKAMKPDYTSDDDSVDESDGDESEDKGQGRVFTPGDSDAARGREGENLEHNVDRLEDNSQFENRPAILDILTRDDKDDDDDDDDDIKDESDDEVDEDDEDRLPGLARAHLNKRDVEDVESDDYENTTSKKKKGSNSEDFSPQSQPNKSHDGAKEEQLESTPNGDLSNPDVMDTSETMDAVRDINVSRLGQLQRLDKNDPAIKRLMVRPRLSIREVKAIRLDPDIKAIVDDFLRTNITGDFTIARVLRENYASFHPWLASHIQAERNAWAVRLRQTMEAGEKTRREGLDSAAVVVEAGLRLRELVQTCSNCMYGHSKTTAPGKSTQRGGIGKTATLHTNSLLKAPDQGPGQLAPISSVKSTCPGDIRATQNSTGHHNQHHQHHNHIQRSGPAAAKLSGELRGPCGGGAASIFRMNGLAKASLASEVDVSALNQKLIRLTTMVGKDNENEKGGADKDSRDLSKKDTGLTPSPMNMLRVEDTDIYNYESDPGVYSPAPGARYEKRRVRRGVHEGYLYRKRTTLSHGSTHVCDGPGPTVSKPIMKGAPSIYGGLRNGYRTNNRAKKINNQWSIADIETLLEREFGPDTDGNTRDNGTDWSEVARDNLDVLTELCRALVTERSDCFDVIGCTTAGESSSLVFALQEYLRAREDGEDIRQEEMECRLHQLEDENHALQAEMALLKKALSSTNGDALNLRQQIARLEALVSGVQPEMINKCVGTADSLPPFLPKPRMVGGGNNGAGNGTNHKNGFNPFSTLQTATLVYSGAGANNRYAVKATLAKGRRRKGRLDKTFGRTSHPQYHSDVSDSEAIEDESVILARRERNPNSLMLGRGSEAVLDSQTIGCADLADDSISMVSAPAVAVVVPQVRLGLEKRERSLVEISEEKLETLKQRAQRLENSLQDALSSMEAGGASKPTPRPDNDSVSTVSGASSPSRGRDKREPTNGRTSAKQREERPKFWTEPSFEVTGSPPPGGNSSHSHNLSHKQHNNHHKGSSKVSNGTKAPRQGPVVVIKRPSDFSHHGSGGYQVLPERRAVSETLPFTLEHEKSSLLSGRALPLAASSVSPDKALLQATPRNRASPAASVVSINSNKDKGKTASNNHNNNKSSSQGGNSDNSNIAGKLFTSNAKETSNSKEHRSSFYHLASSNKQASIGGQFEKTSHDNAAATEKKKTTPRPKPARTGGVVAKCLRCQKLFNSVDNHKLACCYHPKEKARFEHYDGSGRLVAVVHAWQCCQQPQDADGCCFGQHV